MSSQRVCTPCFVRRHDTSRQFLYSRPLFSFPLQSCQADLVKDNGHKYFLSVLADPYMPVRTEPYFPQAAWDLSPLAHCRLQFLSEDQVERCSTRLHVNGHLVRTRHTAPFPPASGENVVLLRQSVSDQQWHLHYLELDPE